MARTTRKGSVTTIDLSGPFFEHDPRLTMRQNIKAMMAAVAEEGERDVRAQIAALPMAHSTGWTLEHVKGRVVGVSGRRWQVTAVVSTFTGGMSKEDSIRTKAAGAGIERRWHPFRKTTNRLRKSRKVNAAELLKGLV